MEISIEDNIKRIIDERGLKRKYVAEKSGFGEIEFNNILNGRKTLKASHLLPISSALGVTIGCLFGLEKGA